MKYEKTCEICQQVMPPAKSEAQANRNLGLHKRNAHGIRGKSLSVQYKLRRLQGKQNRPYNRKPTAPEPASAELHQVRLDSCPICGSRFYAVKGKECTLK